MLLFLSAYKLSINFDSLSLYQTTEEAGDTPGSWTIDQNEHIIRGIDGKELAIYKNGGIFQWNVWGLDNAGKIDAAGKKYFYFKDHLGNIRCVIDETEAITSSKDYDMWGYEFVYRSGADDKYDFTSKERDSETGYDYFGARYYLSRTGRWGSVDPFFQTYISFTPYNYSNLNPILFVDPDGRQIRFSNDTKQREFALEVLKNTLPSEYREFIETRIDNEGHYILNTERLGQAENGGNNPEFASLLSIANSTEITEIIFQSKEDRIEAQTLSGVYITGYLTDRVVGLTIVSGNIDNTPDNPNQISLNGTTQVYVLNSQTTIELAKTLGHELYGHAERYISGKTWAHIGTEKDFDLITTSIEERISKNLQK